MPNEGFVLWQLITSSGDLFGWTEFRSQSDIQLRLHHLSLSTTTIIKYPRPGNMLQYIPLLAMLMALTFVSRII